jgi:hypothetical protein
MGEFRGRISIGQPAAEVFGFLSDPGNMPRYLPTVRKAELQGPGRILMEGEADGHAYRDEGWLKLEADALRMRWGSGRVPDYEGMLEVLPVAQGSEVSLRLSITPEPAVAKRMEQENGAVDHAMRLAMDRTLAAIKAACEGQAGGPEAPDAPRSADDLPDSRPFGGSATLNPDI